MGKTIFISGIDTDAGKTYATGWLAKNYMDKGLSVATQKFIQTGNKEFSEDIEAHRKIMGIEMLPEDIDHTTAPIIFNYPASAQLAARIDGREIDLSLVDKSRETLSSRYDILLIEGAGGLMGAHNRRLLHDRLRGRPESAHNTCDQRHSRLDKSHHTVARGDQQAQHQATFGNLQHPLRQGQGNCRGHARIHTTICS